jgi:lysophospholipase L1-like esterase
MSVSTEAAPPAAIKKPSRLGNFIRNAALSLASFGFCLLLTEVALRWAGYGNVEIYLPDPIVYWRLKPNQDCFTKVGRKPVHINSHGTRGVEFMVPKPTNVVRILSMGDSVTFGWGLTEEETYSKILERTLQEKIGDGVKVEVINAGVNAWSYPQMAIFLREYGLRFQPDYAIVAGANLWTQFSENSDPAFVKKFMSRVRLKNFLRHFALYHYVVEVQLEQFYQKHRAKFVPVDPKQDQLFKEQQKKDPDAYFRDAIQRFCEIALTNGIKPVILHTPNLTDLEKGLDGAVLPSKKLISEKLNVPLVDPTADLKSGGVSLYLEADPVHFNAEGNKIVAARLSEVILSMVKK